MKIADEIITILEQYTIKDNTVFLPEKQLDRATYTKINKCLENIGGKWSRKSKGHIFDYNPTEAFENIIMTGKTTDFKKARFRPHKNSLRNIKARRRTGISSKHIMAMAR